MTNKSQSANRKAQMRSPQTALRFALCALRFVRASRSFTLLEVMISILILALALLGLGAVIPAVLRTQKLATDAAQGVTVASGVQTYLASRTDLNRLTGAGNRMGWGVLLLEPNWSPAPAPIGPGPAADSYLWEEWETTSTGVGWLNPATGEIVLEQNAGDPPVIIGVGDRLWPARHASGINPEYVFDLITRRVNVGQGQPHKLQVAIFVRRIDANIPVPRAPSATAYQWTLYDVLTGTVPFGKPPLPPGSRRLPVAVDQATGLPTFNGLGDYANHLTLDVMPHDPSKPDRLTLIATGATPEELMLARQVGQKWVDNLGNVYTVIGADENDPSGNTIFIEPPVPAWVPDPGAAAIENQLREVAFTPHVPAYVSVFTVTPMDPK